MQRGTRGGTDLCAPVQRGPRGSIGVSRRPRFDFAGGAGTRRTRRERGMRCGFCGNPARWDPSARSWHPLAWPWCPQGGDIPVTLLFCVSPGPPRKTRHRGTGRPEGEEKARPCHRRHPSTPQPRSEPGVPGLSHASPCLRRVKLDPPARGATPGRKAEPACPGGRGKAAPWASWGHGVPRVKGAPPAPQDLRATLGFQDPQG